MSTKMRIQSLVFVIIGIVALISFNVLYHLSPELNAYFSTRCSLTTNLISFFFLLSILVLHNQFQSRMALLERESEKMRLSLSDHMRESILLTTLNEIIAVFGRNPNLDDILNRIAEASQKLTKADNLILQVYSSEERRYFTLVVKGNESVDLGEEILEDVILSGNSALVNNTESFSRYRFLGTKGYSSFLAAPLKHRGESIGLLAALGKKKGAFTSRDLDLMTTLAVQASLLIENATLMEKTKRLSITDGLTNLFNRRYFEEFLKKEMGEAIKNNQPCSIAMLDVDNFKHYNDTHGHQAGDEVLRTIGHILQRGTKGSDIVARYGGEEFVVIFSETTLENAALVCRRLNRAVNEHHFPGEETQPNGDLTVSIGVASYPGDGTTAETVLKKADDRLYSAKEQGRDRVISE
ncbi:MAG: sensor domain-containing diguanylate cyclase [Candidatus Omnitrophota bacterium]